MLPERQPKTPQQSVRSLKNIINTNRVPLGKYIQQKTRVNDKNLTYFERLKSMIGNPESQYKAPLTTQLYSEMNTITHTEVTPLKKTYKEPFATQHERTRSFVGAQRSSLQKRTQPSNMIGLSRRKQIEEQFIKSIKADIMEKNRQIGNRTTTNLNRRQNTFKAQIVNYKKFTVVGSPMADEEEGAKWGKIQLREVLGSGANAKVRHGICHGLSYAVKIYQKYKLLEPKKKKRVYAEAEMLRNMPDHPNIIALNECFEDKRQVHMIFEHLEGAVTLQEFFRNNMLHLEPKQIRMIFIRIAKAVAHLHQCGIAHRDIKPENILISFDEDGEIIVKLIDFGFATTTTTSDMHCGTPNFMAPELLESLRKYNPFAVDVWALGITLFYLCEGRYPFKGYDERDLFRSIRKGAFEVKKTMSPVFLQIFQKTITTNVNERISAQQLTQSELFYSNSPL